MKTKDIEAEPKKINMTRRERMHLRWDAPHIQQEIARKVNSEADTHPMLVTHSRLDKVILTLRGIKVEEGYVGHPSDLLNPQKNETHWLSPKQYLIIKFFMAPWILGSYYAGYIYGVIPSFISIPALVVGVICIPVFLHDYKKYRNNPEAE